MIRRLLLVLFTGCLSTAVLAQENSTCPALLQAAMTSLQLECEQTDPESICYGNGGLSASQHEETFAFPGASLLLTDLETLVSHPMDTAAGEWGVAVAKLHENQIDAPTTLLIFGDVELTNLATGLATQDIVISSSTGANARTAPNTDARILQPLIAGQTLMATGRLDNSSWIRVQLPDNHVGWVLAELVRPSSDNTTNELEVVDPTESPDQVYRPMRAFEFRSGIDDAPCGVAPPSGILIQTAEEITSVFRVNDHSLDITGTVFLQAGDGDELEVNVLEGTTTITQDAVAVEAGEQFTASGGEHRAAPYDYDHLEMLPLELLPRQFILASNWEAVLIPAKDQPLADVTPSDGCTIAVVNDVNVRVGPGRDYALRGSMLTNQSAHPTGRAVGTDGRVWWRVAGGTWLSFDVTFVAGDCNTVPLIETLPRQR